MPETIASVTNDDVDPDIRRFVDALNEGYGRYPDFNALPLVERRLAAEAIRQPWRTGGPQMARSLDLVVGGTPARIHYPTTAEPMPAMIYIHGGGWTMFSIDTHDRLMREYAAQAGIAVIGLDYSLSPEAKFPVALSEVGAAIDWVHTDGPGLGLAPALLFVGGDSAGANLAVATCLELKEHNAHQPKGLVLNYGAFSADRTPSHDRFGGERYMLTPAEMDLFWENYTRDPSDLANPLVSPLRADLVGLPPVFMAIAECDILADGNRAMAQRFSQSGVAVQSRVYPGATHSFLEAMSISSLAREAIRDTSQWLVAQVNGNA